MRVEPLTDHPEERFRAGSALFIGPDGTSSPVRAEVRTVRAHRGRLLVRFDLAADREAGQRLTGQVVFVPIEDVLPTETDSYYEHELVGLAIATDTGVDLGRVAEVLETGSAPVLIVRRTSGPDVLIPMIADVIQAVDLDAQLITITPLPGLLD